MENKNEDTYENKFDRKKGYSDTLTDFNSDFFKKHYVDKCDRLINDVDIKIDSLKTDLENIRDKWFKMIEAKKRSYNNDEYIERTKKENQYIIAEDNQIEKLKKKFKYDNRLPIVEFKPLKEDLRIEIIGRFKQKELILDGNRAIRNEQSIEVWHYIDNERVRPLVFYFM